MGRRRLLLKSGSLQRRVHFALERARTRLAIAYASERKRTTAMSWQAYTAVEDRMRRYLRRLRTGWDPAPRDSEKWIDALQSLENLPSNPVPDSPQGATQLLFQHLFHALDLLEGKSEAESGLGWIMLRREESDGDR